MSDVWLPSLDSTVFLNQGRNQQESHRTSHFLSKVRTYRNNAALHKAEIAVASHRAAANLGTAFTVSIDARGRGVTTGISSYDRAQTILVAVDPRTRPEDLARPGHVFPLRSRPDGVLERGGQTEASVDLARLAGLHHAVVICEIMNRDGSMARGSDLARFCPKHGLTIVTVAELVRYRLKTESEQHQFVVSLYFRDIWHVEIKSASAVIAQCRA